MTSQGCVTRVMPEGSNHGHPGNWYSWRHRWRHSWYPDKCLCVGFQDQMCYHIILLLFIYNYTYNRVTSICIDLSKIKLFVFVFVSVFIMQCLEVWMVVR